MAILVSHRAIVISSGRLGADRLAMLIRQKYIVASACRLAMLVRQRAIVALGGRLVARQAGNFSQAESNSHLRWQTDRQTGWQY